MHPALEALFDQGWCDGQLCVQSLAVALEAETQFADGRLDPRERITLRAAARTPGPTGFSLFGDDVGVALRDLVPAVLTISDNDATDALLHRIGIDAVNASSARLGLAGTVIAADLRTLIDSIGTDAGFADWAAMTAWAAEPHGPGDEDRVMRRMRSAAALVPERTTRTTPRDMATLLRLIWPDQAGPAPACARVRQLMGQQLTRHRLAAAFPPPARVAAKSGGLVGVVRNEVGVITLPGGRSYAAAVFTQARQPWQNDAAINAVIGTAAAAAIGELDGDPEPSGRGDDDRS